MRKKKYKKDIEQKCIVLLSLEEAMKPPLNFDLNQSPNNDDAQPYVEETLLPRGDFNIDLNQAPSQVNVQQDFENHSEREDDATHEGHDESEALLDEYGSITLPYEFLIYFFDPYMNL